MKVIFLIEALNAGGKERRLIELLKGLCQLPNKFDVYIIMAKSNVEYKEIEEFPVKLKQLAPSSNIQLIHQYNSHFAKIQPDIVHSWSYKTSFYASILKPFFNYKLIVGFIGDTFGLSAPLGFVAKHLIYKKANAIISNSRTGLEAYKVNSKKGMVIYNGFDQKRIKKFNSNKPTLSSLGINTTFTIVMLANVTQHKDYNTFIKIAQKLTKKRNDITFLSVGKIKPEYNEMVAPYLNNKCKQIKFIGFYSNPESILQESDIGILCSYSEGISNAILEYMAVGLPVITTDTAGASKELVDNEITGFICEKEQVLEKIDLLLSNINLRRKMGEKGRNRIQNSFSINKTLIKYIELYNNVINENSKTSRA